MREISGATAFVTGGDSGIGLGIAEALCDAGTRVVICGLREDSVAAATDHLGAFGDVHGVVLDVRDRTGFATVADDLERRFGGIDILVNNAGVGFLAPAVEATFDQWDWVLATNLTGVFNGVRTFVPRMLERGRAAHVVATASIGGMLGTAGAAYVAAKFGVVGFMEALATELRDTPVDVSILVPGIVRTNIAAGPPPPGGGDRHGPGGGVIPNLYAAPMEPREVGDRVVRAIRNSDLYVFTHAEHRPFLARRFEAVLQSVPEEDPDPRRAEVEATLLANPIYEEVIGARG